MNANFSCLQLFKVIYHLSGLSMLEIWGRERGDGKAEQRAVGRVQRPDLAGQRLVGPPVWTTSRFTAQRHLTPAETEDTASLCLTLGETQWWKVNLLKHNFMLLYTSTPLHYRRKFCNFYSLLILTAVVNIYLYNIRSLHKNIWKRHGVKLCSISQEKQNKFV